MHFAEETTVHDYLKLLLKELWREGECFSGKRPFGDSGWEYDLYIPLVRAGVVVGEFDYEGDLDSFDIAAANKLVLELIDEL